MACTGVMEDSEQLERLTVLRVQQSEQAAQREERLAAMLKQLLVSQLQLPAAQTVESGQPAAVASAAPMARLPSGA
ncbi:hypothetical protein FJT64_025863 [Amphibalanus amphitrite]|uniref:Uncharacterized protein n=1 Tax=Amphibalanus amphitrite TaxID=1232801 RepID=A0A6A4W1W6_AMPAM|nr:hypothetical protein FJT64_025863 [Amphibalanus amphitrite]